MPPGRRGPRRRPRATVAGGHPLPLPLVAAVAASNITATAANLIGTINPQGLSGSCWFVWGTSPQFGSQTGTVAVAATSIPQTSTVALSGLTSGVEYWFAMVGQTAAGTVTSAPLTFTPQTPAVTDASQPTQPTSTPDIAVPHFRFPFSFTAENGAAIVEQDSVEEILTCVQMIAACSLGACPELPTFGIPDPTFQAAPPNSDPITDAIELWEPRAIEDAFVQAVDATNANWAMTLTTSVTGTGQ